MVRRPYWDWLIQGRMLNMDIWGSPQCVELNNISYCLLIWPKMRPTETFFVQTKSHHYHYYFLENPSDECCWRQSWPEIVSPGLHLDWIFLCLEIISCSSLSRMNVQTFSPSLSLSKIRHFPSLDWKNMQESIWHNFIQYWYLHDGTSTKQHLKQEA